MTGHEPHQLQAMFWIIILNSSVSKIPPNQVNKTSNISQLCSDWWELTDEDDYSVSKFEKAIKDDKLKRQLRHMMTLEILSIAVVNYYTSSPDVLKPSQNQIQQVKNLLSFIQQNYLGVVEIMIAKLPDDLLQNKFATQL